MMKIAVFSVKNQFLSALYYTLWARNHSTLWKKPPLHVLWWMELIH